MTIDIAIIPVAGHGTRLLPATKSQPKEMLSVGRKPVVQYVVEELGLSGIRRILFVTSRGKTSIEQHFDIDEQLTSYLRETGREEQLMDLEFEREDMEYFYTRQRRQLGLGHAVLCARSLVGNQPFVVALGDSIIGLHAQSDIVARMIEQFDATDADVVVAFERVPRTEVVHYGIAKPRNGDRAVFELEDVIEKPAVDEAPSDLAVAARYVFSPAIFDALEKTPPGKGGEIQLTDAIRLLLKHGRKGLGVTLSGDERRFDIGNFDSYFRTFAEFAMSDVQYGPALRKFVRTSRSRGTLMELLRRRAYARAGLMGNPSDGYHGKTLSVIVRNFSAEVVLYEWEDVEIVLTQEDRVRFRSVKELVRDVDLHGYYGGIRLVKATIKKFVEYCRGRHELHDQNFSIRYETNICEVGLAGSSAIIVATTRALMEFYQVAIPLDVQPSFVLSVERDELGIAAGLQDRVVQVYGGLVYMDFSREGMVEKNGLWCGKYEPLDPALLPPLYVAYSEEAGEPTEVFHNNLRARYDQGEPDVVNAMQQFASLAQEARDALVQRQTARLSHLIDRNFDLRRSICRLPREHVAMIEVARRVGASAKFAGSGGAIIGAYEEETMFRDLVRELGQIGCRVIKPDIA